MKRYLSLYRTFIKLNIERFMAYRVDLINGILGSIVWGVFSIAMIYALTAKSASVFGWTRQELFVLVGVFNIMIGGTFRAMFAKNFDTLANTIQRGELDSVLLKPLDSQFMLSFQYISVYNVVRIILSIVFTGLMLQIAGISFSLFYFILFLFLAVLGIIILYAFWYIVLTLLIWFPDLYNLVETLYAIDSITRFPPNLLSEMRVFFVFIFLPLTLVVATPAKALLHKVTTIDVLLMSMTAVIILFVSRKFWKFALRYYTSASG